MYTYVLYRIQFITEIFKAGCFFLCCIGVAKSRQVGRRQQLHGVRQGVQSFWHRNGGAGSPDG